MSRVFAHDFITILEGFCSAQGAEASLHLCFHISQSYAAESNPATVLSLLNQLLSTSQNTLADTTYLKTHK